MANKCETCEHKEPTHCFEGVPKGECPKRRLENEKLIYSALLIAAVTLIILNGCCQ